MRFLVRLKSSSPVLGLCRCDAPAPPTRPPTNRRHIPASEFLCQSSCYSDPGGKALREDRNNGVVSGDVSPEGYSCLHVLDKFWESLWIDSLKFNLWVAVALQNFTV